MTGNRVVTFQSINLGLANLLNQARPVGHQIPAQVVVTGTAGLIHIPKVEAELRCCPNTTEMRAMPLAAPRGGLVATNATEMIITEPDVAIDYRLSLAQVLRPALQLLLPRLDLPAVAVGDGLPRRLGVPVLGGQGAGWGAHALPQALRDELGAALGVLADLGLELSGGEAHTNSQISAAEANQRADAI